MPAGGRIVECYGEDPYLNGVFCVASVKGFQGNDLSVPNNIAACLKHYRAYGLSEGGRDYRYTDVSRRALRETYFSPFKASVDAEVSTLMSAFNDINGTPASANHFTLTEVFRDEWGSDGFVVSDWCAINELISHGIALDKAGADAYLAFLHFSIHSSFLYRDELLDIATVSPSTMNKTRYPL
jgi:beta-glucosidase